MKTIAPMNVQEVSGVVAKRRLRRLVGASDAQYPNWTYPVRRLSIHGIELEARQRLSLTAKYDLDLYLQPDGRSVGVTVRFSWIVPNRLRHLPHRDRNLYVMGGKFIAFQGDGQKRLADFLALCPNAFARR